MTGNHADPRDRKRFFVTLGIGALIVVCGIVAIQVVVKPLVLRPGEQSPQARTVVKIGGPSDGPARRTLPDAESLRLDQLLRSGIAYLENLKFAESDAIWIEIEKALPEEPLPARNRAIGRLLAIEEAKATTEQDYARAAESFVALRKVDPKSHVADWLEGRMLVKGKDRPGQDPLAATREAVAAFQRATKAAPNNVVPYFEIRQAAKRLGDDDLEKVSREALEKAYELAPGNLFVALEWLEATAEMQDARFVGVAKALKGTLGPLAAGIQRRTRIDPREFLDQAIALAEKGQWRQAQLLAGRLGFVRVEDIAQNDLRRARSHPLELILQEFQTVEPPPNAADRIPAITVRLQQQPLTQPFAQVADLHDFKLVDVDLDGTLDVVVLYGKSLSTYYARGSAWELGMTIELPLEATHLVVADLDRDDKAPAGLSPAKPAEKSESKPDAKPGAKPEATVIDDAAKSPEAAFFKADPDVIVYGPGGVLVVANALDATTGARAWKVTPQEGNWTNLTAVRTVALADIDHDGDLDLACASDAGLTLWTNRGNMTFDEATQWSVIPPGLKINTLVAVDWDRDVDVDFVALGANDESCGILENLRHTQFRWSPFAAELVETIRGATNSLQVVESDGNASWDLAAIGDTGFRLALSRMSQPGQVTCPIRSHAELGVSGTNLIVWDYDNDGNPDFLGWGPQGLRLLRGRGVEALPAETVLPTQLPKDIVACDTGDLDRDGDLDLMVATANGITVLLNDGGNKNHWLDVWVKGIDEEKSGRVNHFALGSTVELRSIPRYQAQLVQRPQLHFGLGRQPRADILRVIFTNGVPQNLVEPKPDQTVREEQRLIGSCPYLYAWNGERFEFVTDLLWAAPLGLQVADGVIMRDRPWEYLKVDGAALQPRDGAYQIQITEELWEAGYFDQVELFAVDHPADIEVFTNEKVGPPALAEHKLHPVRQRRLPRAARDSQGRDQLETLRTRDGVFAECFERTLMQGLAEPHYLELDLGELTTPQRITLFLTGWIYPTDTSLNIGLGQNPARVGPKPPRILVPDADGQWREAVAFMGFPGGKTKTIAVDISKIFPANDYRLRIETSAELRWDELFFTVDEEPVSGEPSDQPVGNMRVTPLGLRSAELHYRGHSRPRPRTPGGPELYDYAQCEPARLWPPMRGRFTRYGDVHELLTAWDDRMVVLGAGDEMTLAFDVGPELPPGWKRDFVLHNVGWDKDCVLNTIYGQTVEPMPFREMPAYPYEPHAYPARPELRAYLEQYQTREQSPWEFWRQVRDYDLK